MSRPIRWNEVTAVLGGTFDPPHLGHREVVRGLFENPGVRDVLIVPAGTPPFKAGATSAPHRLEMTELGFEGLDRLGQVRIDRRELERSERTGKPSYTIDTLLELRRENPHLAFVAGADQLAQLHLWHRFPELLSAAHWIVLARKNTGSAMETLRQWEASGLIRKERDDWSISGGMTCLKLVDTPAPAISSSEIREEIARSTDPAALRASLERRLFPSVLAYLMEHRVYGMSGA